MNKITILLKFNVNAYFQQTFIYANVWKSKSIEKITMNVSDNIWGQSMSRQCHQYVCRTLPPDGIMGRTPASDGTKKQA